MRPAVARLALCIVLFLGWLGYLAYLVLLGKPVVLSRPQILVSQFDVIATISEDKKVTVKEVLYPKAQDAKGRPKEGIEITVTNIDECKPPPRVDEKKAEVQPDFKGAG